MPTLSPIPESAFTNPVLNRLAGMESWEDLPGLSSSLNPARNAQCNKLFLDVMSRLAVEDNPESDALTDCWNEDDDLSPSASASLLSSFRESVVANLDRSWLDVFRKTFKGLTGQDLTSVSLGEGDLRLEADDSALRVTLDLESGNRATAFLQDGSQAGVVNPFPDMTLQVTTVLRRFQADDGSTAGFTEDKDAGRYGWRIGGVKVVQPHMIFPQSADVANTAYNRERDQ